MSTETITATIRLKIVCPFDSDWNALGKMLRSLRAPLHRVLNGVVRELELARHEGPWWEPTPKDVLAQRTHCHPQTASYRIARDLWLAERESASQRVADGKPWSGDESIAATHPSSQCVLGAAGAAYARWNKYHRKDAVLGLTSLPSFKGHSPIYVTRGESKGRVAGVKFRCVDGRDVLSVQLSDGWTDLVVTVDGGSAHASLARIRRNEVKLGDVRLLEKDRTWFAMLAYTMDSPKRDSGRTMALHRGIRTFLACAVARSTEDARDAYATILETGDDVVRHKQAYAARRRSLSQQGRQLGIGAKGHGIARRQERITKLEDAESRWVRSKCQEVAAHACRIAERKGATRILIEDWSNPAKDGAPELGEYLEYYVRSFPFASLREAITWAAKRRGIAVESIATERNSRTCPSCLHEHDKAQVGTFLCDRCKLERNVDVIFAWNMLRRSGFAPGIEESKNAVKREAGRLRKGKMA